MKIVVVGNGKVGYTIAKLLSIEGHEIVVIDKKDNVLKSSQEELDVSVVNGNGASVYIQKIAGVCESDLLIAATSEDEINLLCCMIAHKLGCKSTVARVRNPEYDNQIDFLKDDLGLSFTINPEKTTAKEIFRLLQYPSFLKRDSFAKGRVELVEIRLQQDNILCGKRLDELSSIWNINALICGVERGGTITIPSGGFRLEGGDKISVAAGAQELVTLIDMLKINKHKINKAMIIGGSRIAAYLAERLIKVHVDVTIIEENAERCSELSLQLPKALIINGNGTLQNVLLSEGIEEMDAVVTLTGLDEANLIISLFANYIGIGKTITKINRSEYMPVFGDIGMDAIVSPKLLTSNEIMRYVRAVNASEGAIVNTLYRIMDDKAEALEFTVPKGQSYVNTQLYKLKLKKNILLAAITRGDKVIIPNGNTVMMEGDSVIIVAMADDAISSLSDIFI